MSNNNALGTQLQNRIRFIRIAFDASPGKISQSAEFASTGQCNLHQQKRISVAADNSFKRVSKLAVDDGSGISDVQSFPVIHADVLQLGFWLCEDQKPFAILTIDQTNWKQRHGGKKTVQ
ncbi:hypothetical protein TcasGA2_TC000645 [Tribolium castaneum]|uniref:Uncharacterized protein n=1 Tax=Tribolium castaneum TaxID=7070 RepID=D6W943_TRICA|nr:hypothetical protein TcasGA2_TC000645 [Tribolium castaneum]